jgi:hypothetical protein
VREEPVGRHVGELGREDWNVTAFVDRP